MYSLNLELLNRLCLLANLASIGLVFCLWLKIIKEILTSRLARRIGAGLKTEVSPPQMQPQCFHCLPGGSPRAAWLVTRGKEDLDYSGEGKRWWLFFVWLTAACAQEKPKAEEKEAKIASDKDLDPEGKPLRNRTEVWRRSYPPLFLSHTPSLPLPRAIQPVNPLPACLGTPGPALVILNARHILGRVGERWAGGVALELNSGGLHHSPP